MWLKPAGVGSSASSFLLCGHFYGHFECPAKNTIKSMRCAQHLCHSYRAEQTIRHTHPHTHTQTHTDIHRDTTRAKQSSAGDGHLRCTDEFPLASRFYLFIRYYYYPCTLRHTHTRTHSHTHAHNTLSCFVEHFASRSRSQSRTKNVLYWHFLHNCRPLFPLPFLLSPPFSAK